MLRRATDLTEFVLTDPLCRRLAALGEDAGLPLVLVGGGVRDWLLGRPALDWDLIVPGDPAPLLARVRKALGRHAATLDDAFGVYRLVLPDGPSIDFTRLQGADLDADLRRRDLTVNALACRLADGVLLDPTGGLADLEARVIRAVSRANLVDDPLRLLRVFRFMATLPGTINPATLGWVRELAPEIQRSAGERIWAELLKLLPAPPVVALMEETGLLGYVLPEAPSGAAGRLGLRPLDVRTSAAVSPALAAMVGLLDRSPAALDAVAARLHWSKRELAWTQRVVAGLPALSAAADPLARFRVLRAAQDAVPGIAALATDVDPTALLAAYWDRVDHPPPKLLDGKDLMKELGLAPGPHLARLLTAIEEAQALGTIHDRAGALALAAGIMQ
ncbi:MAG: pcnB [Cyanobacteria bacterium RYN_339]|nr:pcnB [Cyanobacteria bacterium RYN_339]